MNAADADRQISQMIEFIKQEAREKAEEITVKTDAEANALKLNKIHEAKVHIKAEYEKKHKEIGTQKSIARSRMINDERFNRMRARNNVLDDLAVDAKKQLAELSKHTDYPKLVKALLIEGFLTIVEKTIEIRCRQEDLPVVEEQLPGAIDDFKVLIKDACNATASPNVTINKQEFLPPGPTAGFSGVTCAGGIHLVARHGKILCRNTLDARFDKVFQDLLPAVREMLFGARAAPVRDIDDEKDDDDDEE